MTSAVETPPSNRGRWGPSQGCLTQPNGGRDCWALTALLWPRARPLTRLHSSWMFTVRTGVSRSRERPVKKACGQSRLRRVCGRRQAGAPVAGGEVGEKRPGSPLVCLGFDPRALAPQCLPGAEGASGTDSHLWIVCSTVSREGTFFCWI